MTVRTSLPSLLLLLDQGAVARRRYVCFRQGVAAFESRLSCVFDEHEVQACHKAYRVKSNCSVRMSLIGFPFEFLFDGLSTRDCIMRPNK